MTRLPPRGLTIAIAIVLPTRGTIQRGADEGSAPTLIGDALWVEKSESA